MIKKILADKRAPFVFIVLILFAYMSTVKLMTYADDQHYSTILKNAGEAFGFARDEFFRWSGRYPANFFSTLIMRENIWLWRILNTGVFLTLIFGIYRIARLTLPTIESQILRWVSVFFIVFAMFAANLRTMKWGAFWVTGSFSYLWPTAAMVFILYIYFRLMKGEDSPKMYILYYLPFLFFGAFHEQTGAVLIVFALIALIYYYVNFKKVSVAGVGIFGISLLFFLLSVLAPGNKLRFEAEIPRWYPMYGDLTLWDRFISGVSHTVFYNFFFKNYVVTLIFLILMSFILIKRYGIRNLWVWLSFVPTVYIFVGVIYMLMSKRGFDASLLFNFNQISVQFFYGFDNVSNVSLIFACGILLLVVAILYKVFGKSVTFLQCFLIFGACIASSFMVSFSPTIFASGERIFFVGNILLTMLATFVFYKAIKDSP